MRTRGWRGSEYLGKRCTPGVSQNQARLLRIHGEGQEDAMGRVIIIGGGAAGMMAGIAAARNGHQVQIYEKNEKQIGRAHV